MLLDMVMLSGGIEKSFEKLLLARGYQIRVTPKGTLPFDTEATMPGATALMRAIAIRRRRGRSRSCRRDLRLRDGPLTTCRCTAHRTRWSRPPTLFGYGIDPADQGLYQVQRAPTWPRAIRGRAARRPGGASSSAPAWATRSPSSRGSIHRWRGAGAERRLVVRGMVRWLYDHGASRRSAPSCRSCRSWAAIRAADRVSLLMVKVRDGADVPRWWRGSAARTPASR